MALEDVVCKTHEDFTDKIYAEEERKYIDDYLFRKEMQKQIVQIRIKKDAKDILKEIIHSIIKIFDNYEEYTTRVIYISKWI